MPGVTDVHVHLEPYQQIKPAVLEVLLEKVPDRQRMVRLLSDPRSFLEHLDRVGVERACLINYVAPDVLASPKTPTATLANSPARIGNG